MAQANATLEPVRLTPDGFCRLESADFCAWPGYSILRLADGSIESPAQLDAIAASRLGQALARATAALERATHAERVYWLVFAEVDRRFHVHLLPRTRALARGWAEAAGVDGDAPPDGPAVFNWARATFPAGAQLPAGAGDREAVWRAIVQALRVDSEVRA